MRPDDDTSVQDDEVVARPSLEDGGHLRPEPLAEVVDRGRFTMVGESVEHGPMHCGVSGRQRLLPATEGQLIVEAVDGS